MTIVAVLGLAHRAEAQLSLGTWVRQPQPSSPAMTMVVDVCCGGNGRRLTYHVSTGQTDVTLVVESPFDGTDAPVTMAGKPTGETMAIKRLDDRHATAVLKMSGTTFGTGQATLSPDGNTLTIVNEYTVAAAGHEVGKVTEVWLRK
jgi:hypothetical protein